MPSPNLNLIIIGLIVGVLSTLYPQLPIYLPPSITNRLPFLPHSDVLESHPWESYQRYQASIPIIANHDPYAEKLPEGEKRMRMGSKIDKADALGTASVEEGERGIESAGKENQIGVELPVYFIESAPTDDALDPDSTLAITLARIGNEITSIVRPETIVILVPLRSKDKKIMINSSPLAPLLYSHIVTSAQPPYTPLFTCSVSPAVASTLLNGFSDHSVTGIPSIPWTRGLDPPAWSTLIALFGEKTKAKVVQVSIPFGVKRWEMSEMVEVGKAMRGIRDEGVVIIGVGLARKRKIEISSANYLAQLKDILLAHTSIPREEALISLMTSAPVIETNNPKVQSQVNAHEMVPSHLLGLFAIVGAAGEGEAEMMDVEGGSWRFGSLPMRSS